MPQTIREITPDVKPTTQPPAQENVSSHFGFINHFAIRKQHKETAERYGIQIHNRGNRFGLSSKHGAEALNTLITPFLDCLLYTSPSPRDLSTSRMPSSA